MISRTELKKLRGTVNCEYCGKYLGDGEKGTRDHIRPRSKGGSDTPDNLAIACGDCNTRKGNNEKVIPGNTIYPIYDDCTCKKSPHSPYCLRVV